MSKVNDLIAETSQETLKMNLEFLQTENPKVHFVKGVNTSPKFDPKREEKIAQGLETIKEKMPNFNPLVILLASWWENKEARAEVKKLIDAEAEEKGYDKIEYMQVILRNDVEALANLKQATNRLLYAINYYKPRGEVKYKNPTKQVKVGDELYSIEIKKFEEAKNVQNLNKKELRKFVIENGTLIEGVESI